MGRIVNTFQLIERAKGNINSRYDIYPNNIADIENISANYYDLIVNGFRFGYMQGMKAAQAGGEAASFEERRKKA